MRLLVTSGDGLPVQTLDGIAGGAGRDTVVHERQDLGGDHIAHLFEGEVAGVEQVVVDVGEVAPVGLGAGRGEDGVVASPDDERRWLVGSEVLLPLRVVRGVGAVAEEQLELDVLVPGAVKVGLVEDPVVGADGGGVLDTVRPLPLGGLEFEQGSERRLVLFGGVCPVGLEGDPEVPQSLVVGVSVLDDQARHAIRVGGGDAEADGGAVVLHVHREGGGTDDLGELVDDSGQVVKGVLELIHSGGGAVAEAGVVGRDDAVLGRQRGDEIAEHVRRGREAVKQQDGGRVGGPGLAVEDVEAVHPRGAVVHAGVGEGGS